MHICCIAAFSCYCFITNATYRLVQVKWFTPVIRFECGVLPQCSCRVPFWNQIHPCFYSVKSQLALPLACYSSHGSHAALRAPPHHTETKSDWQEGSHERHEEHKQGCKWKLSRPAKLSSSFLFILRLIDLLITVTGLHIWYVYRIYISRYYISVIFLLYNKTGFFAAITTLGLSLPHLLQVQLAISYTSQKVFHLLHRVKRLLALLHSVSSTVSG